MRAAAPTNTPASAPSTQSPPVIKVLPGDVRVVAPQEDPATRGLFEPRERGFLFSSGTMGQDLAHAIKHGLPSYVRDSTQVGQAMRELVAKHPDAVRIEKIGQSVKDATGAAHDILALRLGIGDEAGKPTAVIVANQHAREIGTGATALRWASELLDRAKTDPEARMMLEERDTVVVPIANPVGFDLAVNGIRRGDQAAAMQRKNGPVPGTGTDPNRNYPTGWGEGVSSADAREDVYRGPKPFSEPETRALRDLITKERPGIVVDVHSFSELVMAPGSGKALTDRGDRNVRLAERLAWDSNYVSMMGDELYRAGGALDSWAAGPGGAKSAITLELGTSFHPTDKAFERTYADIAPMLDYAVKAADAPLSRAQGPELEPTSTTFRKDGSVTAVVSDRKAGNDPVVAAELVTDPGARPGAGRPLTAIDGKLDEPGERIRIPASALASVDASIGAFIRSKDSQGHWGALTALPSSPSSSSSLE